MKNFKKMISILMVLTMLALPMAAVAATTNPTPASPGYMVLPFHLTGALSGGTLTGVVKFNIPFAAKLITVQASCRALSGGPPTVDVKLGGTTVLSAVVTLTVAGTVYEGTITTSAITDEGVITVDVATGTSVTDITLLLVLKRL